VPGSPPTHRPAPPSVRSGWVPSWGARRRRPCRLACRCPPLGPDSPLIARPCRCTASSRSRRNSSRITTTWSPTASRTAVHRTACHTGTESAPSWRKRSRSRWAPRRLPPCSAMPGTHANVGSRWTAVAGAQLQLPRADRAVVGTTPATNSVQTRFPAISKSERTSPSPGANCAYSFCCIQFLDLFGRKMLSAQLEKNNSGHPPILVDGFVPES
jgi:hypothetical protein